MAKKQSKTTNQGGRKRKTPSNIRMVSSGESIYRIAHYMHETVARHCEFCSAPMTPSDVEDYSTLCRRCFLKEYGYKPED